MKKALIIVNPIAGKRTIQNKMFSIINMLCENGFAPTVLTTLAKNDAAKYVIDYAGEYDIVICCGGDGTLNETITGMMNISERKPIGYIPCGSTNDMANTLCLSRQPIKAVETIIRGIPTKHDIGKFGEDRFFTYIASFGIFTKSSYQTPQSMKNVLGHFAYVLQGASEIGDIHTYRVRFTFDDNDIEDDFLFASISNTISFAGLFSFPQSDVNLSDGKFELLLIKKPKNIIEFNKLITSITKGNYDHNDNLMLFHTDHIIVEPKENLVWTVDGECSGELGRVVVDNVPDTIYIMQNAK